MLDIDVSRHMCSVCDTGLEPSPADDDDYFAGAVVSNEVGMW